MCKDDRIRFQFSSATLEKFGWDYIEDYLKLFYTISTDYKIEPKILFILFFSLMDIPELQ